MRSEDRSDPRLAPIIVLGAVTVLGTAWFAWSLPATASRRSRPSAALAEDVGPWRWAYENLAPPGGAQPLAITLVVVSALMFAAWGAIVLLTWKRSTPGRVRVIVACAGLAALIGVAALPTHSSDIYDYALFGRVAAANGGDPYQDLPDAYPEDPLYRYSSHQYTGRPDNKLPAWTLFATAVADVAGDHPLGVLVLFRVVLGGATVLSVALIAHVVARLRPDAAAGAAAVYGLCPVTLVYGGAKTDAIMVLLAVLAVGLVAGGRGRLATVASTLAVLVKAIAAPVLALVVLLPRDAPQGRRRHPVLEVGERALVVLAVAVAVYAPFRDPIDLIGLHLGEASHSSVASHAAPVVAAGLVGLLIALVLATWQGRPASAPDRARSLVNRAAPLLLIFAMVLTRPGLPWYLMTPLAIVAISRSLPLVGVMMALTGTSFVMGWWESTDTRAHPLPELHVSRPFLYLAIALAAAGAIVASVLVRQRRGDGTGLLAPDELARTGVRGHAPDGGGRVDRPLVPSRAESAPTNGGIP